MNRSQRDPGLPRPGEALPGRDEPMKVPERHQVLGTPLRPPWPAGLAVATFGMGCFWGAEKRFWSLPGVQVTAVGYAGGVTPNPTYEEVCTGRTGHAEVVRVGYDPLRIDYQALLRHFWEGHDPTQGMRQGNDRGTQYRSMILCQDPEQYRQALASRDSYQARLTAAGHGRITTWIGMAGAFYFAEPYHQQYLARNPHGYCGHGGTGVPFAAPAADESPLPMAGLADPYLVEVARSLPRLDGVRAIDEVLDRLEFLYDALEDEQQRLCGELISRLQEKRRSLA